MIERALITVSNKEGIIELARELAQLNIEMISTGGTFQLIQKESIPIISVEDYTNSKEVLGGRVKTLHPKIHAGILAKREDRTHMNELKSSHIKPIDLVVVNLYPFEKVIQNKEVSLEEAIENIDIGGVALLRASAKNFHDITVLSDPKDYSSILDEIKKNKSVSNKTRYQLALKAFKITSHYDTLIFNHLNEKKYFLH